MKNSNDYLATLQDPKATLQERVAAKANLRVELVVEKLLTEDTLSTRRIEGLTYFTALDMIEEDGADLFYPRPESLGQMINKEAYLEYLNRGPLPIPPQHREN